MIEVKIINKAKQAQTNGGFFASNQLANEWISKVEAKIPCPWGEAGSFDVQVIDNTVAVEAERIAKETIKVSINAINIKIKAKAKLTDEEMALVLEYIFSKI